ncbi:DNA-binding protein [Actinocorallia aurantiaca]|uniref:DNA-binding protein n=1 Tax=Actinocorallia aurantiaca TaxID=46204 RepID=A0ABP6GJZ8_9ACTN
MSDVERLLEAGAVLPPGTGDAGENAVPLTARAYRHPGLDGRVVVRLSPAEPSAVEDLAAGFLGLEPEGVPEVVGVGRRVLLGFPEWVLAHHPEDGHHALAVVPELERVVRRAKSRPKAALTAFHELAARLASSVPHLLPTFYERAAREFLAAGNLAYAAQLFTRAREVETEYGLPIDEERHDEVFLEFALAGVLRAKTLSSYASELSGRVPADEALRRFSTMCVRRTAGGMAPSVKMATDLQRLAKAAGEDVRAVEQRYLAEVLALPATVRAVTGWWKAHKAALVALAKARPEVRGTLLDLTPQNHDGALPALWLEILEESGATAALCDPENAPEEARPEDGTLGWSKRFQDFWARGRRSAPAPALYPLVERMAGRLKTELAALGEGFPAPVQTNLLDLLLALGVPVADPPHDHSLDLEVWAGGEPRRDLLALAADPRFRVSFHHRLGHLNGTQDSVVTFQQLIASPGGGPMLAEWMEKTAREAITPGLPALPGSLQPLERLPGSVFALARGAVRRTAATDLAQILARALRAGIFAELGWPAWDEALAALGGGDHYSLSVSDAMPYLIVANAAQVRVIGAEGTVLVHDLRLPAGNWYGDLGFHYVDGELLVYWRSVRPEGQVVGYWHDSADRVLPMTGHMNWSVRLSRFLGHSADHSLALPEGGRTTGAGVLHRGDTGLPPSRKLIGDGRSYWVRAAGEGDEGEHWYEYDPRSGELGRRGGPAFITEGVRGVPKGGFFAGGVLMPAPTEGPNPIGVPVDGLVGWRVVSLPDGSSRGEDLAGNTITTPRGVFPSWILFMPGGDRPGALSLDSHEVGVIDPDGVVTAQMRMDRKGGPFAAGTSIMPPVPYWYGMRPRDPRGSEALRRIDRETAAALIEAASADGLTDETLAEAVRALIPGLTHESVVAGVGGFAKFAARRQKTLDMIARRLENALSPKPEAERFPGPSDHAIRRAISGVGQSGRSPGETNPLFTVFGLMRRAMAGRLPAPSSGFHPAGTELRYTALSVEGLLSMRAALAYHAVSVFAFPEDREVLGALLKTFTELGMAGEEEVRARWRRLDLRLDVKAIQSEEWKRGNRRALLPLEGGAFLAVLDYYHLTTGVVLPAIFYDPAGRFEVPSRYEVVSSVPLTAPEDSFSPDRLLAEAAARGPAPWFPEAAEEFARLTGVTGTMAKLVVAGLPGIGSEQRNFLPAEARAALKVKVAEAAVAGDELRAMDDAFKDALVGALVPSRPSRLWTDGPDVAEAARVWNREVGERVAVPESLAVEAAKAVRTGWNSAASLPALLDPASEPLLCRDLRWVVRGNRVRPEEEGAVGFTGVTLVGAVAMAAWLAHRLPAGDPLRGRLPAALTAVRDRLANPDLMLGLDRCVDLSEFRRATGTATEVGEGFERYGAVVMATVHGHPCPGIRPALLDENGGDPHLPALRDDSGDLLPVELSLRLVRDERFVSLLADPGDPAAGERGADGTWWPQDPTRSVPGLVAEAAERYGLSPDAAAVYLMLLAMPDPTDRDTARWTGWRPARIKAARAELAATDLVLEAARPRASRSLFLPCGWNTLRAPHPPQEEWKLPLYDLLEGNGHEAVLGVLVPAEPVADLYRRAWRRITEGDVPRFADLEIRRRR